MESSWLHRYSILLAVCTLILVVAGASVTSKQAGLSVPDWPLSYGQVMPPMTGGVFFEHGHRMVGTLVGVLTIGLVIWLWRADKRSWMRKLGWVALLWVSVVGLLGGLTVKLMTPPPVSITHTCLAQLFFALTVTIAVFTSKSWRAGPEMVDDQGWPPLRSLGVLTPVLVLAQIALGAGFRHRAITVMPHIAGAMIVALVILLVSVVVLHQFPAHRSLRPAALALLLLTFVQVFLGIATYLVGLQPGVGQSLPMVLSTVAHVATGALTLAASVVLAIHIRRSVRVPARQAANPSQAAVTS